MVAAKHSVVYLSAYACDPDEGSESGAGWAALISAEANAKCVILFTREGNAPNLETKIAELNLNVETVRIPTSYDSRDSTYRRYIQWLWRASKIVKTRTTTPGVFQHATFASDWMPIPIFAGFGSPQRVVWGPAGGSTYPPFRISMKIGLGFALKEVFRHFLTASVRRSTHRLLASKLNAFIALNADAVRHAPKNIPVLTQPNCVMDYDRLPSRDMNATRKVVFVGRLIELKGIRLIFQAFEHLPNDWSLTIVGDGPLRVHAKDQARTSDGRITVTGQLTREGTLNEIAAASVMIFPSLHDSVGWAAAEASGMGVPVVCLDLGGPQLVAGPNAKVVAASPGRSLARRLSQAVASADYWVGEPFRNWTKMRMDFTFSEAYGPPRPSQ